jgi:hypothetical protein
VSQAPPFVVPLGINILFVGLPIALAISRFARREARG